MATPQKKHALVDSSNDDDDRKKKPKKPRTSLVHARPQNLKCWVCGRGVMVHTKIALVGGKHGCTACGDICARDN